MIYCRNPRSMRQKKGNMICICHTINTPTDTFFLGVLAIKTPNICERPWWSCWCDIVDVMAVIHRIYCFCAMLEAVNQYGGGCLSVRDMLVFCHVTLLARAWIIRRPSCSLSSKRENDGGAFFPQKITTTPKKCH